MHSVHNMSFGTSIVRSYPHAWSAWSGWNNTADMYCSTLGREREREGFVWCSFGVMTKPAASSAFSGELHCAYLVQDKPMPARVIFLQRCSDKRKIANEQDALGLTSSASWQKDPLVWERSRDKNHATLLRDALAVSPPKLSLSAHVWWLFPVSPSLLPSPFCPSPGLQFVSIGLRCTYLSWCTCPIPCLFGAFDGCMHA